MQSEKTKPFVFMPLSQIDEPTALLHEPGDEFRARITKSGIEVMTLHTADGVKRAKVRYKSGKTVNITSQ